MRTFLAVLAAWLLSATLASAQMMGISGGPFTVGSTYSGPGDIVSGATGWYSCTRSYNAAYNTGSNKGCNLRRAANGTTQDINILTTGKFDSAGANSFAGTDATCQGSTTGLSTTIAFTSCSSTPTALDTVSGAGFTQPSYLASCGSFVGGAGSCTLNAAQNIAVAETVTMQVALFVAEAYDQSGNTNHVVQATAGNQPQWLPNCGGGYPCMFFNGADNLRDTTTGTTVGAGAGSIAAVAQRTVFSSVNNGIIGWGAASNTSSRVTFSSASANLIVGGAVSLSGVTENVMHLIQSADTQTTGTLLYADGTGTSGTTGGQSSGTFISLGSRSDTIIPLTGYIAEAGLWDGVTFSTTQIGNLCHNAYQFYVTGTSC